VRSDYDRTTGLRRQRSIGPRTPATERLHAQFEEERRRARERMVEVERLLDRQAAVNRVVGIGRVPLAGARIIRALDGAGLLGTRIRIVGAHAVHAYEAAAGGTLEPEPGVAGDGHPIAQSGQRIGLAATGPVSEVTLLALLRTTDRSFETGRGGFRAVSRSGFAAILLKPPAGAGDAAADGPGAAGLAWLDDPPPFEAVALDERGAPVRIVAPDPRLFVVHRLWLSEQPDRSAAERTRDRAEAESVAAIVSGRFVHLPFDRQALRAVPPALLDLAEPVFRRPIPEPLPLP
ncbi:MAG TPA: GSU2403 family nucleotidyltransferase fold protein, partial [Bauldia sp.]|nr:GSU2403 family nucleotidyltransferase fold protein [Bauldia sp.]